MSSQAIDLRGLRPDLEVRLPRTMPQYNESAQPIRAHP
jgi:hypothetical protein